MSSPQVIPTVSPIMLINQEFFFLKNPVRVVFKMISKIKKPNG